MWPSEATRSTRSRKPVQVGARRIDGEKHRVQPLCLGKCGRFDGKVHRLFQRPSVALFNEVRAGGDLNDDAAHAAVGGQFHIIHHTAAKTEDLRCEITLDDFSDRGLIPGDTAGMPASIRWIPTSDNFSAMRILSSLVKIIPACCSPSRRVTSWILTLGWRLKAFPHLFKVVPWTYKPILCFPRCLIQSLFLPILTSLSGRFDRNPF